MKSRKEINKEKDHLARVKKKHRAEFFANLKEVCNLLVGYDLYSKLPSVFLEKLYSRRMRQVEVVIDKKAFTAAEIKEIREYVYAGIETTFLEHPHGPIKLSLILVEGQTLIVYSSLLKDDEFPGAAEIREALKIGAADEFQALFNNKANEVSRLVGALTTYLDRAFVICKMTNEVARTKVALQYQFTIEKVNCIKETFVVDGIARPAFRVGWGHPFHGVDWASIKPKQKGITKDSAMPVFIQSHALQRLEERTDLLPGVLQYSAYDSIQKFEYTLERDGRFLISFYYYLKKIGYLVASVINNRVLIHTFLFITNNGTPEGRKLSEITGLKKLDKKYLAIDKLSTFLSYRINDNEFVKKIFEKAGCGHLVNIEDKDPFLHIPSEEVSVEAIAKYLKRIPFFNKER